MANQARPSWLTWVLLAIAAVLLAPMIPAVILAIWFSGFAKVIHRPLTRGLGGRNHLAAAITLVALATIIIPFGLLVTSLGFEAYQLVTQLLESPQGQQVLAQLVAPESAIGTAPSTSGLWELLLSQKERAWQVLALIASTASRVLIATFVILAGVYSILIDGDRWYQWVESHAPVPPAMLARLRDAFFETGRGLFLGIGGAGLLQSIVATIMYVVLGVPRAAELGLLTFCVSIIPAIGTALVWVPIAAGLALTERTGGAIALTLCGIFVIGTIDNLVRPILARRGQLQLPTYVVLVAMFAGVMAIGAWGLLLAPLAVRLTKAALESPTADPPA